MKLWICLLILPLLTFSQSNEIEKEYENQLTSILKITSNEKKIDSLEEFSRFVVFQDYKTGEKAALKLIELTRHHKNKKQFLTGYNILGLATYYSGENEKALLIFDTLIKTAAKVKDTIMEAKGHGNCGLVYERLGNYKEAFAQYTSSLKCAEKLGNKPMEANANGNLGNVSIRLGKFHEAINYFKNAISLFIALDNKKATANQYNSMSQAYDGLKDIKSQVDYLRKAEAIYRNIGEKRALGTVLTNLGSIESDYFHNTAKSIKILEEALELKREMKDENGIATVCLNLSAQYAKESKYNKAFTAVAEAKKIAESQNDLFTLSNVLQKTSMIYRMTGDYKNAYRYYDEYIKVKDSILGQETQKAVAEYKEMYESEKKQYQIDKLKKNEEINKLEIIKNEEQLKREKAQRYFIISALLFFVLLFMLAIWAFIQKRKNSNQLQEKNHLLEGANQKISHQKEELVEKQKEILDSIYYAKKIQNALLASEKILLNNLAEYFILFKPKDIVSGDFTWATIKDNLFYLACCDSTGHGVPGAFMSLLNIGFLSEAIKERNITEPGKIFDYVRKRLIETIGNDDQKDGFDGILICMDIQSKQITYAAANNSPLVIRNKEIIHLNTNKMPVGDGIKTDSFDTFSMQYESGDALYLYTDGYPDQFGGPKGKKFKYKPLEQLLSDYSDKPVSAQKEKLESVFKEWKGNLEQVDDVCIIGIKL